MAYHKLNEFAGPVPINEIHNVDNQNDDDEFITLGSGRDGIDGVSGVGVAGAAGAAGAAAKAQQIRKSILKAHISGKAGGCEI